MFLLCSLWGGSPSEAEQDRPRRMRGKIWSRRSVSRVLSPPGPKPGREMAIHLGRPLPNASLRPTRAAARKPACELAFACRPYSVLLPVGFTLPSPLPTMRCALTAPFHPYRIRGYGGLLSVALSLGLPPPAVNRHRVSMEPGLSSPRRVSPLPKGDHPTVWTARTLGRKAISVNRLWRERRRSSQGSGRRGRRSRYPARSGAGRR